MIRPDGIPADVWANATAVAREKLLLGTAVPADIEAIARALLAAEQRGAEREREACAMVATEYSEIWKRGFPQDHPEARSGAGREIAAAIRGRKA